jgi:LacI family transcriptional regulator
VLLYTTPWLSALESSALFSDRRTDGIIVVAPREPGDVVSGLVTMGFPVAVLSSVSAVPGVPSVAIDNHTGVRLALDHLRALGHTRIAFAGAGTERTSMRERYEAYVAWVTEQGSAVNDAYVMNELRGSTGPENVGTLEALLRRRDRPTAIFAVTDDLAAEVLDVARNMGLTVPHDLSVVGFDDILLASLTVPKLTTVRLPLLEMGRKAAKLLIDVIEDKRDPLEQPSIETPELIVRNSTARVPTETS